eukprot:TRINITY_DN16709_c0_g1_i1.p1 TRINITY_DN16709_c0_g1~~TRINITY_DN16709_c0_g1_i1.p1  ORF type:complete len:644 (-),score=177.83 TRINITY_DN16709_c0_g1_i1:97-2028(-)
MGSNQSQVLQQATTIGEPQQNGEGELDKVGDALDLSHRGLLNIPDAISSSVCDFHQIQLFNNRLKDLRPLIKSQRLIDAVQNCRDLNIAGNFLKELPAELGQMRSLQALDVGYNHLENLEESILHLPNLKRLVLRHNAISSLETDALQVGLEHLDLTGNQFTSMPGRLLYKMTALKQLLMASNKLELVDGIELLSPNLEMLDCSNNQIMQLPACAFEPIQGRPNYALTGSLTVLLLHNQTEEKIEKKFFSWGKAEEEDEEYAQLPMMLRWNVYHTIRRADNLQTLNLSSLGLWDKCFLDPEEMMKLHQDPTYQPEDKPDDALSYLVNLTDLDLSFNNLDVLSPAFASMTKLKRLILRNNQLNKLDGIRNLVELEELDAQYNVLTSLPVAINNLTKLSRLLLNNNRLKSVPATLMHCNKLHELTIGFNSLQVLPEELGTLDLSIFTFHPNPRLTHPPKDVQAQGAEAMLAWMRSRVAHSKMAELDPKARASGSVELGTQMVDLEVELWGAAQSFGTVRVGALTTLQHLRDLINLELDTAPERYQFVCDNCAITGEVEHRELALTYMPVIQLYDESTGTARKPEAATQVVAVDVQDTQQLQQELIRQLRRMKMLKKMSFTPQEGKEAQIFKMPNPLQSKKTISHG